MKLFLLALVGVGAYGAYYGYGAYEVGVRERAMGEAATDLHQALMRLQKDIGPEDVRQLVLQMAARAGVSTTPEEITVSIEPLDESSMQKLPAAARTALGIAAKIPRTEQPRWVVGFNGRFSVKHGVARRAFVLERYTWYEFGVAQPTEGP